jgi:peptide/nickel transport system permease protein
VIRFARFVWGRKTVLLGAIILASIVLTAVLAPFVSRFSPEQMRIAQRLQPPGATHWFGTDEFGRDLFARVVYGGRTSLAVGALTVALATVGGVLLGVLAGFLTRLDATLTRVIDAMMAFPDILLAIALVAVIRPPSMANVVIALGIVYIPRVARVVRASTLVIRETTYIEAARALGLGTTRIVLRHVLRNLVSPIVVQSSFVFAYAILAEAGLSFLGLGPSPETPTWGTIIASGQEFTDRADWIIFFPGLAIVLSVFALQMVGDGLRDLLDPRLRKDF